MTKLHRFLLATLLAGNALVFAGIDPPMRLLTAVLVGFLALDLRRVTDIPAAHRWALLVTAALVIAQLVPLPFALRSLLQPGLAELIAGGWAPLSVAPWATLHFAASALVVVVIALTAARMAATRSGLPTLLTIVAAVGVLTAILGFISEYQPYQVVLLREHNTGAGQRYGPFVNPNHFALAMELTVPAALVLAVASLRQATDRRRLDGRGILLGFAALVAAVVSTAAMIRSGSRGGVLALAIAAVVTIPWWRRSRSTRRRWPWALVAVLTVWVVVHGVWAKLPHVREEFAFLFTVEGTGNSARIDFWDASIQSAGRAPLLGAGVGAYRFVIGPDSPPAEAAALQQAHNDWLEWLTTAGAVGGLVLVASLVGLFQLLRPDRVRNLRHSFRYPAAGAMMALTAVGLHETIDFGLQIPLNRYLCAAWVGLLWGVATVASGEASPPRHSRRAPPLGEAESVAATAVDQDGAADAVRSA